MRSSIKISVILASTLLVGAVLGGVIVGHVIRDRLESLGEIRQAEGFANHVNRLIGPVSPENDARVQAIIKKTGDKVENTFQIQARELEQVINQMEAELKGLVSEEQLAKWRETRDRVRSRVNQ